MKSLEIPQYGEVYLVLTSRNIGPVIVLGPLIVFCIYYFVVGLLFAEPWWFKIPFLFLLPLAIVWILMLEEPGFVSGKIKCIISSDGVTFLSPQNRVGRWLEKKLQLPPEKEFQLSWDDITSIRCNDKFFERRKKGADLPRDLRIIFHSKNGEHFELDDIFMSHKDKKFKSIYSEIKKQAMLRGIPFETELDNEEVWKKNLRKKKLRQKSRKGVEHP